MTDTVRDRGIAVVALAASGMAAYLFLVLSAHTLGPARFAPLGTLWSVVFLATAALGAPLETEVARRVGAARGRRAPYAPDVVTALTLAGSIGFFGCVLAAIAGGWVDDRLFAGEGGYTVAGGVAFAGLLAGSVAKGACAGTGRLAWWGTYLLVDGGSRCLLAVVATVLAPGPTAFAAALAISPWLALILVSRTVRGLLDGGARFSRLMVRDLVARTSPLLLAAIASSSLMYLGAVMLPALVGGPDARVGSYVAALSLARLPLFALSPVVAVAVPRIAYEIGRGAARDAIRGVTVLVGGATVAGSVVIVATPLAGGKALAVLFGAGFTLTVPLLLPLAVAAAAWLVTAASAAALVGAGRPRLAAAGWCAGLVVAAAAAAAIDADPFVRTNVAVTAGAVAAALTTVASVGIGITHGMRNRLALAPS